MKICVDPQSTFENEKMSSKVVLGRAYLIKTMTQAHLMKILSTNCLHPDNVLPNESIDIILMSC